VYKLNTLFCNIRILFDGMHLLVVAIATDIYLISPNDLLFSKTFMEKCGTREHMNRAW